MIRTAPAPNGRVSEEFIAELKRFGASKELISRIEKYNLDFYNKEITMWDKLKLKLTLAVDWVRLQWDKFKLWVMEKLGKGKDELKSGEKDYDGDHPA